MLHTHSEPSKKSWAKHFESLLSRKDLGFFDVENLKKLHHTTKTRVATVVKEASTLAVVGIGGSSLGARVIVETFGLDEEKNVLFFDNVDPIEFDRHMASCRDLKHVHWLFISKSGTTIETLAVLDHVDAIYKEKNLRLSTYSTVITEPKPSALNLWAEKHKVPSLEIPLNVGGRFSVLTPVGLFPAEFLGVSGDEILGGAAKALKDPETIGRFAEEVLNSFERGEWITVFWFYSSLQRNFGLWLEQLWAESLAKKTTRKGGPAHRVSSPFSCVGSTDQHSVLQQFMEGAHDKFVVFVRDRHTESSGAKLGQTSFDVQSILLSRTLGDLLRAEAQATQKALESVGVSTWLLETDRLDEDGLGQLFMFFQLLIGTLGEALDINAFDQPGVELGKRLARDLLKN